MSSTDSQRVPNVIQARDKKGRRFFYDCTTQLSHWFQPRLQAVAPGTDGSRAASVLPPEAVVLWAEKRDRKHRKVYLNLLTGSASRHRPSAHSIVAKGSAALLEVADTVGPEAVAERPPPASEESEALTIADSGRDSSTTAQLHERIEDTPGDLGSQACSKASAAAMHAEGGGSTLQQHVDTHPVSATGPRAQVRFHPVLSAPTGNSFVADKPPSPVARPGTARRISGGAIGSAAAPSSNTATGGSIGEPRRPRTPPLADASATYGAAASSVAPSAMMPSLNRASLRLDRPGRQPAVPSHVTAKIAAAAQDRSPGLLEQRKASRQRRMTFNPFSAVTALPGHGHRDEAAAVQEALQEALLLRPAQQGKRELSSDEASESDSLGFPSPRQSRSGGGAPPPSSFLGSAQEATDAGDILFKEGIRMHDSGRLQRGEDRYATSDAQSSARGAPTESPRTAAHNIVARHAHAAAPGWATVAHAKPDIGVALGVKPPLAPLPPPSAEHPLSPPWGGGGGWSWDGGSTVLDTTSLWDGSVSDAWTENGDALAAVAAGGGVGAATRGPVSAAAATGRRLNGTLVNVHALVEAAAEGQVVWVETIDQADGRAAAVPFVKSGGAILQGDAVKRPTGTLGAPGGDGGSAQQTTHVSKGPRSGRISLVQWTGHSAKRLASPEHGPVPPQRMLDRSRVIEAVTHGELQREPSAGEEQLVSRPLPGDIESAAGSTLGEPGRENTHEEGRFSNLRVSTAAFDSEYDSDDGYSLLSGATSSSWMPPAPGPLYVLGRPLTTGDLNLLYGGGSVDINVVSGSGPPTMPPTRGAASNFYHEEMPSRDSSGSPGSRGARSPTLASMTPRTQGRYESWTRKATSPKASSEEILAAAASDYQAAATRRTSFAVESMQAKRAARQSNPGARSGFGFEALPEGDEQVLAETAEGLTPASRAVDGFVPSPTAQTGTADSSAEGITGGTSSVRSPTIGGKPPPPPPPTR